ncbi:hypothetical protein GX50_02294 [[Emmonsia] crescens]|uniref:Synaptobrevin n=1 Tax=[Emmonsia] crescens TaxID=73230 RepID=A0A2B7ZEE3_9EURO|nr:hypothetical protein GX50_02294 [Emmonsia crescens]
MARKLSDSYSSPDITSINLTHLLARLDNNILSPSADLKLLRRSPYHRARVGANIEYARTLILKLELSLPNIKIQSRKHALQTDLAQKRQQIKALKSQLDEIAAAAETEPDTQTFSSDTEEDLLPTPSDSTPDTTSPPPTRGADKASTSNEEAKDEKKVDEDEEEEEEEQEEEGEEDQTTQERRHNQQFDKPSSPSPQSSHPTPSNTLRSRHHYPSSTTLPTATATGTSLPTTKPLFPNRPPTTATTITPKTTPQTALFQNETEQDTLTTSLLALATQLKTSTQNLHTSLESEKSIIARAAEGLDRSTAGMEAAGKRMGALRRMAEGKGWWGRALMYVWIFGLWIVAFLIVFVGPKLRF